MTIRMTKLTDATNKLREVMRSCGSPERSNRKFLAKFYVVLTMIFILGTVIDIFRMGTDEFEEKIFRFKSINILICGLTFPLVDEDTYRLITMIDDRDSPDLGIKLSEAQKSFQTEMDSALDEVFNQMYIVTMLSCTLPTFGPLLSTIVLICTRYLSNAEVYITFEDLSLPFNFWYPAKFANSYSTYIFLYALQIFYMYHFAGYMYCSVTAGLMALKKAINEMKLLCLIVEDWNEEKKTEGKMEESIKMKMETNIVADIREGLINVVKLHDSICRKVSSLNSSLEKMYTVFNNMICFQICICLYSSSKMEDLVLKIEHLMLMIPLALITFLYCSIAQSLLNEGEKFRVLLWESSFFDKPKWFRTSLLLIMTRTSKELEIRPYGFYILNLRTFSMVMNAAYSYFNMLNSLRSRI